MDQWGEDRLTLSIENRRPVELTDLTRSLLSFADEYRDYIETVEPVTAAQELRLYVKEIRAGSIVTELVALAPFALPLVAHTNTVITFAKHVISGMEFLLGRGKKTAPLARSTYKNLHNIVDPVAKDSGSQLNIGTNNGPIYLAISSMEANAIQNGAAREIARLQEPQTGLHEKVLLRWYQARADATSQAGDRGIIESITLKPVKVICSNDVIKSQMILRDDVNPFKEAYIVDVMVDTVNGRPALYKVLAIHDRFELPE